MTRGFLASLAAHDAAQDRYVHELRARGYAVEVPPYDEGDTYRPDAHIGGCWLEFKLHHTVDEKEAKDQLKGVKDGRYNAVLLVLGCADAKFAPCVVQLGPWILDEVYAERVRLSRTNDPGLRIPHGFYCRSLYRVFPSS